MAYTIVSPGGHELDNGFKPSGKTLDGTELTGRTLAKGKGAIIIKNIATGKSAAFKFGETISLP